MIEILIIDRIILYKYIAHNVSGDSLIEMYSYRHKTTLKSLQCRFVVYSKDCMLCDHTNIVRGYKKHVTVLLHVFCFHLDIISHALFDVLSLNIFMLAYPETRGY